jgi:hypothetical protein
MAVSATVVAGVRLTVQSEPGTVSITEEDVVRGYVDVPQPFVVHVRTNSRQGYLLQVANAADAFSAVELTFGDTSMNVKYESFLQRPYVPGGDRIAMHARLRLAPQTRPGLQRVAVALSASAL